MAQEPWAAHLAGVVGSLLMAQPEEWVAEIKLGHHISRGHEEQTAEHMRWSPIVSSNPLLLPPEVLPAANQVGAEVTSGQESGNGG